MQNLSTKTSLIIVGVGFLVGVAIASVLYSLSLPVLEFPIGYKVLIELFVYLISLFLFSNYKIKPDLWLKGLLIIVFFRILFSIMIASIAYMMSPLLNVTFGSFFIGAFYSNNYVFLIQVLLSPCLAYPLLIAVITEKVELEIMSKADSIKPRTAPLPPPPPKTELPPEWLEEMGDGETTNETKENSKSSGEISAELLKELGLTELIKDVQPENKQDMPLPKKGKPSEVSSDNLDDELKALLGELDSKSLFEDSDKKTEPIEHIDEMESLSEEGDVLIDKSLETEPRVEDEVPLHETIKIDRHERVHIEPLKPDEESKPTLDDLELPAFEIPGVEALEAKEQPEVELPEFNIESSDDETAKSESLTDGNFKEPIPEEALIEDFLEEIPPLPIPPLEDKPPMPLEEPPREEIELPDNVAEEIDIIEDSGELPELPAEASSDFEALLKSLEESELPDMSFDEKPIVSLDDLPPLPDFPGLHDDESEKPPILPIEKEAEERSSKKKASEKKTKAKPAEKELAEKPSDTVTISVRRIIDYGKTSEASAVLNKLLRRGSDYKLQVPLWMIIDQLSTGKIELTADYIYNQVPIELVNFISAEQGRNLQELTLMIPLSDIMQQVSPAILMEKMPDNQNDSVWAAEASELSEKIGFDEKDLGK